MVVPLISPRAFSLPGGIPSAWRQIDHLAMGTQMAARAIALAAGTVVPPHAGPEVFLYVLEGRGKLTAGGETLDLTPGKILYVPPGLSHSLQADTSLRLLGVTATS